MKLVPTCIASLAVIGAALGACSGKSERNDGEGGPHAGEAGDPSGGSGGGAGTTPTGGDAGTVPTGGTAGAPTGGQAGAPTGGAGGGDARECQRTDVCDLYSDCCTCMAIQRGSVPPSCDLACTEDRCSADGIGPSDIACVFGRCVVDRSCNHADAACDSLPEPCPDGQVRSVVDGCWGPCLPPTECSEVTDCESCGDAVCVMNSAIGTRACVAPPDGCSAGNYCECLHACPTTTGFECIESDGAVVCYCATC